MTKEFECLLQLFVNGAVGKKTLLEESTSVERIISLSIEHNIYYSVIHSLLLSDLISDIEQKRKYEKELKNLRLAIYVKNFKLAEILKQFEEAGIPYAVLKGFVASSLYYDPYSRVSSDTDVLINEADERKAISILVENGFVLNELSAEDTKHSELFHQQLGTLELHVSMYNDETACVWLGKRNQDAGIEQNVISIEKLNKFSLDEISFYTLLPDAEVEFLFMHNLTHFVAGGTSIKAIMDFFLAYIKNQRIDYESFYNKIKALHFDIVLKTMFATIQRFLPGEDFEIPFYENPGDEYVQALLEDMEKGKWLGYGNNSYDFQRKVVFEEKSAQLEFHQRSFIKKVFPSSRYLRNNYKYAMEHPCLVPVAWTHRLFYGIFRKLSRKNEMITGYDPGRIDLLKQFDLL